MTISDVASLKAKLTALVKAKVAGGAQSAHVAKGNAEAKGSEQVDQAAIAKGVGEAVENLGRKAIPLGASAASAIGGLLGSSEGAAGTVRDMAHKAAAVAESDSGRKVMDSAVSAAGKGAEWAVGQAPESVATAVGTAMEAVTSVAPALESLAGSDGESTEKQGGGEPKEKQGDSGSVAGALGAAKGIADALGTSKALPEETTRSSGEAEGS